MNLPNKLTMLRVIMVPFFMVFAAMSHYGSAGFNATYSLIAGVLFAAASFIAYMLSGYSSLYVEQKIMYSKLKAEYINIHAK